MLANSLHRTQFFCLNRHCLKKKNKKQKTVQRTSSPGGLWEEAGELGMGVGKRFFKGKRLSKGKDFQSVYIFVPSNFGTVLFLTK